MDWLKCNICFNTYNGSDLRPRSLSCGHTFCEKCLNITIKNSTLTCPQCRKIHELNSVLDLPINFIAEGLLKSLNPSSNDVSEGAVSRPIEGEVVSNGAISLPTEEDSDKDIKSETHGSLKCLLEQQERCLFSQKELLRKSAGACIEHPSEEYMFRCSLHKCWVCEQCIEELGDHPKHKCKITSFKEEIENRRQEHKNSLDDEGKSCNDTISLIKRQILVLKEERDQHLNLVNGLQNLVKIHKKEEETLQNEISSYLDIIVKGENIKQKLIDVEESILNAGTLDDSNAARDIVKNKKLETRNWVSISQREVDEGKLKIERSTHLAMVTKMSLEYRENCLMSQQELEKDAIKSEQHGNSDNNIKLRDIELTRKNLNRILHCYENELDNVARLRRKPWNIWGSVTKVQLVLLGLLTKLSGNFKYEETTTWAVKETNKDNSVTAGQLTSSGGRILLHCMQTYDSLPLKAITLPVDEVMPLTNVSSVVFLNMTHNDTFLGCLEICLNAQNYPRQIQHFIDAASGTNSLGSYRTANFEYVINKSLPRELVICDGYVTPAGDTSQKLFYPVEKPDTGFKWIEGNVYACIANAGFIICTRTDLKWESRNPLIGAVTSGLEYLKEAILKYAVKEENDRGDIETLNIIFSECGLVISSSE